MVEAGAGQCLNLPQAQPDPPIGDGFGNPAKQAVQELPSLLLTSSSDLGSGDQELLVYRLLQSQRYSGPARGLPLSPRPRALCVASDTVALLHLRLR